MCLKVWSNLICVCCIFIMSATKVADNEQTTIELPLTEYTQYHDFFPNDVLYEIFGSILHSVECDNNYLRGVNSVN